MTKRVRRFKQSGVSFYYIVLRDGRRLVTDELPYKWSDTGPALTFPSKDAATAFLNGPLRGDASRKILGAHVEKA